MTRLPLVLLLTFSACRVFVCGNGIVEADEACDDGNDLNDDGCSTLCAPPACGNNLVELGEACDDGNNASGDGCDSLCSVEVCGDGVLQAALGEECDDSNTVSGDGCSALCAAEVCGDGAPGPGEACDDGALNSDATPDACRTDCSLPTCGDGVTDTGEGCDDGNNLDDDGCRNGCALPSCGDGDLDAGELCDDGNNLDGDGCRANCTPEVCGDGIADADEQCDDGNALDGDGCRQDCTLEACGDAIVDPNEACDDGNLLSGDGCRSDCLGVEVCGDGLADIGEQCDNGGTVEVDGCDPGCAFEPLPLRVIAGNLTSGNFQNYDLGHGARIFKGLDADVVLIQEFNVGNNSTTALRGFVDNTFGAEFSFFRENGGNGDIPNGVVSRFPIIESGEVNDPTVTNRDFVFARIDLPNTTRDLWAISLHLLTSGSSRPVEADALVAFIQATIPPSDYLVIGGDLNTSSRTESCMVKLGAVVLTASPNPSDQGGNDNTNAPRNKPFDWVLADAELDAHEVPTVIGPFTFPAGLVFDSRLFTQSELNASFSPILVSDSAAPSMQHMAVVRDFFIPVE